MPPAISQGYLMTASSNDTFPVLPLRDIVVFPHMIVPLFVGRAMSVRALEEVMKDNRRSFWPARRTRRRTIPAPTTSIAPGLAACCSC
jgi:ATP-dependent Lon protease